MASSDPAKIEAVVNMPPPTEFSTLRSIWIWSLLPALHLRSGQYQETAGSAAATNKLWKWMVPATERFVDTFKRSLLKCKGQGMEQSMEEFLISYRTTPSAAAPDGKSPAESFLP
uniref:Uncharacterized protein n=1 Tax=Ditylenchus dipsaci TaxID=166011 RepID=A0A915D3M4_9BILA